MFRSAFILLTMLSIVAGARGASVTFGRQGIEIDAGSAGQMTLKYPQLVAQKPAGPSEVTVFDKGVSLKYASGAELRISATDAGQITLHFRSLPADAQSLRIETTIPQSLRGKASWSTNDAQPALLPVDYAGKPFLFRGDAKRFTLSTADGGGWSIILPHGFQQLQDNREWKTESFTWFTTTKLPRVNGNEAYVPIAIVGPKDKAPELKVSTSDNLGAGAKPAILIDRFGQHTKKEFPDKVKSEDDLKADVQRDQAYFASLNPPATDSMGGLPGSGAKYGLKKTGFFHIERAGNAQVLVNPEGNAFFQLGVCIALINVDDYTQVKGREEIYEAVPSLTDAAMKTAYQPGSKSIVSFYIANLVRKYGKPFEPDAYARQSIDRLRKWGFNSAGAWSLNANTTKAVNEARFPYVGFLSVPGAKLPMRQMWDPFTDGLEEKIDERFAKTVAPSASDPLLIGWFIANEPQIEDVPKIVPTLKASEFAAKRRLVQMLREKYPTIDAFNTAWGTQAESFEVLGDTSLSIATKTASDDMQEYFRLFLDRRYSVVREALRKHDPNHLLIGDRWMPGAANNQTVVSVAGKYLDVVSVNYYAYGIDKAFLDRIHTLSGNKPLLLSEFHFCARDQGLTGGVRQVGTQLERGLAYRNYVEQAAATGYVVGIQWFSALDQATTGRFFEGFNGEAANNGFVNVADRPYKPFLAEVMKTNYDVYSVIFGERAPFAYDDPRFTMKKGAGAKVVQVARLTKPFALDGASTEWPALPPMQVGASGLVLGENADGFDATFRLAWDDQNLYVYAEVHDPTPMVNKRRDQSIWADDALELFVGYESIGEGGAPKFGDRQILLRGAPVEGDLSPALVNNAPKASYPIQTKIVPGSDGKGYAIEAAIPLEALGFTPKPGQEVLFDIGFDDSTSGRRQLMWNGTANNNKDRGAWGRAEFTN